MRSLLVSSLLPSIALALLVGGCRQEAPEGSPAGRDTIAESPIPSTSLPDTMSPATPPESTAAIDTTPPAITGGGAASAGSGIGWSRTELVRGVQSFITSIDSNREAQFWGSLSERSVRMIDSGKLATRQEVWKAAREALGDIENRRITLVGGTRDSVALKIEGRRMIDGARQEDPIIIHLLHEKGDWKVMYPGLLHPNHDLWR